MSSLSPNFDASSLHNGAILRNKIVAEKSLIEQLRKIWLKSAGVLSLTRAA